MTCALTDTGTIWPHKGHLQCKQGAKTEEELYLQERAQIMNGFRYRELFDCKRGLIGDFNADEDDPSKAHMGVVRLQSYIGSFYREVCMRVMHETPYIPK